MNNDDSQQGQPSHQPFADDKETLTDLRSRHVSSDSESDLRERVPPAIPDHELLRCIGRGSYGEVWLARNVMGAYRAVKIVYRDAFESERPYEREFAGIKKFEPISRRHESQVDILHVGRNDAAGYFYYVMELADNAAGAEVQSSKFTVQGLHASQSAALDRENPTSSREPGLWNSVSYEPRTLRSELKRRGHLPFDECLDIALSLTTALQHLHAYGLIHRDIKPANIIFIEGLPKLADIGLVTETGKTLSFVGTEGYLPPEGPNSAQADIFSMGKVFYEICTGKDRLEFPDMPTFIDAVPEKTSLFEFNEVLIKACHNDLRKRYATAAQMHEDLLLLKAGKSVRRSHLLERRVSLLTKLSVAGVAVTTLVVAGYFYQQYQTRVARQLARQNEIQIAQLHEDKGLRLVEEGDLIGALPWFAEALARGQGDAETERRHRLQIGAILQQCPRLLQFIHEPGRVTEAEFCADGHRVVTTGVLAPNGPQYVSEWNLANGTLIRRIDTGLTRGKVNARMSLNREGQRVALWSRLSREAVVYDLRTGRRVGEPLAHEAPLVQAAFSPDGHRVLTAGADHTARLWNPDTGECVTTAAHPARVRSAVIDSVGETILTVCEDGRAYLWNVQSGQRMTEMDLGAQLESQTESVVEFNPDGRRAVVAADGEAQVWDTRNGTRLTTVKAAGLDYVLMRFSPDGELILLSGCNDQGRTAQLWKASTGEPVTPPLNKRLGWWATFRFSPDGSRVLSGGEELTTTLWDARSGENVWPPLPANSELAWYENGVRFSPDGRMALIVSRSVQIWDMTSPASGLPWVRHRGSVKALAFSPDGQWLVSASEDRTARVWDVRTALPISLPLHHDGAAIQARFTSDGTCVLTASHDGTAQIWNAKTGEKTLPPLQHGARLQEAKFSPDGKWIMTVGASPLDGGDGLVRLWNSTTGEPVGQAIGHGEKFRIIAEFTPDSRRVITTSGSTVQSRRVPTGEQIGEPIQRQPETVIFDFRFSPDGKKVLVCRGFGGAQVLNAETFEPITPRLSHNNKRVVQGSWSPDSTKVVTVCDSDPSARVWDATTGRQLLPTLMHPRPAQWPAFSPDGRLILTLSRRNRTVAEDQLPDTVYVWDANTGSLAGPPLKHPASIQCAAFSPDGRRIITGGTDSTVRMWELSPYRNSVAELKAIAQVLSGRRIVGTTMIEPVEPEALQATFRQIRLQRPEYFTASTNDIIAWHRREAEDLARAGREFAARWHANQLKLLTGGTSEFRTTGREQLPVR